MVRLTVLVALVAAAVPGSVEALPGPCGISVCVRITPDGPVPAVVDAWPGQTVWFLSAAPTQPTSVSIEGTLCRPEFGVNLASGCGLRRPGTYPYTVSGFGAGAGTIVVREVELVTVHPTRAEVVYGRQIRLSGTVFLPPHDGGPPPPPYYPMTLEASPDTRRSSATTVRIENSSSRTVLSPGGASQLEWFTVLRPRISTTYVGVWRGEGSRPARIDVRPQVRLRRTRGRLAIAVLPAAPWRKRHAVVQRLGTDGAWHRVARVRLDAKATALLPVRRGRSVRVFVGPAPGYVAGWSRPLDGLTPRR